MSCKPHGPACYRVSRAPCGAPAAARVSPGVEIERGDARVAPPCPTTSIFVCVETFTLRYVTLVAVWSCGGDYGMLGHGDWQMQLLPKKIEAFTGQRVVAVSAGGSHSLALTE